VKRTDRRSDCPTNFALQSFGDSWSLLIIRDLMFKRKHTFSEFANSEERISTNILTSRLSQLQESGIIRRDGEAKSTRYYLTRRGMDLLPTMVEMIVWSAGHDPDSAAPTSFVELARSNRPALLRELERRVMDEHGAG
jgi:DNA-binding HxlR family transcriptional regulator